MVLFDTIAVAEVMQRHFEHGNKKSETDESQKTWDKGATAYFGQLRSFY
jgi:hypothetical protein